MKNKIDLFPPPPSNLDKRKFPRTAKSSHDSDQHGDVDDTKPDSPHSGPDQSAPYPVSRPAPAFDSVDLAAETAQADVVIGQRVSSQLQVIADQVKPLQARAKKILEQARQDARLHQARCAFRRLPGKVYHLYRRADGVLEFSMLDPADWRGSPPPPFVGSYRLEGDMSWSAAEEIDGQHSPPSVILERLLEIPPEAYTDRTPIDGQRRPVTPTQS